ncbi:hypothetical protein RF11_03601 [Thelohanellus kitauei]|uniref:Uncharacterized protein n=1 Tax=Thelohanellus kitauei TaxID=669202 RepID=A0A0C2N0L1_THEKT|nr:hypothetical protein RF11_03601 [Thelohanellus kitauei]
MMKLQWKSHSDDFYSSELFESKFNSDTYEIILTFKSNIGSWAEIKCKISEDESEIEISPCNISYLKKPDSTLIKHSTEYRLKFNKYTQYEFKKHIIDLLIEENGYISVRFRLVDIVIQFTCSNRTCQIINNYKVKEATFYSTAEVYPCENDDHDYTYTNDTCALPKPDIDIKNYPSLKIMWIIVSTIIVLIALLAMCMSYRRYPKSIEVPNEQD